MGKTRQTFSKEFKAKIALEALREESTIQQLSVKYRVHPKVCALIAHQSDRLRELIFSQLLHFNEDIYLKCYETMGELKEVIRYYFNYYNLMRLQQGLDYEVPDDMYQSFRSEKPDRNMAA